MVRRVKPSDEEDAKLDTTDELPALDVAADEVQLFGGNPTSGVTEPEVLGNTSDENRLQALPVLSPAETLRDKEAWIATQDERARSYQRVVEDLQKARADAHARGENRVLELDIAQKALQTALSLANDGERAALDNAAAARAAKFRAAYLRIEVDERSRRVTQLESELAGLRAQIAEANHELAQRAERIAAIQSTSDLQQSTVNEIARERDALVVRVASFLETLQSNEWQRNVWDSVRHELEAGLAHAPALLGRMEAEHAEFAATIGRMTAELAERDAAIAHLEAAHTSQIAAFEELTAARSRDKESYTISAEELRLCNETLVAEIRTLEERQRRSVASLAERETELAASRVARMAVEETLSAPQARDPAHGTRVAELETLAASLDGMLQAQTEAAQRANELLGVRERELAEERTRASEIEAELQAAVRKVAEQAAAARATDTVLNMHVVQLAAAQGRVTNFELEASCHSDRLAHLRTELAHAKAQAVQAEAARSAVEKELERLRTVLQSETERAGALEAAQQSLAFELERVRGALDERELQLRRLERYATSSAQVLSRIRAGVERAESNGRSDVRSPEYTATLVPLDNSDAPALPLGRQTTIGRAAESDLRVRDSSVSRRHAVVTIGPKGAFIEDLCSVNGVKLNHQRVRHARLVDGDVVELGLKPFRFTTSRSASAAAI